MSKVKLRNRRLVNDVQTLWKISQKQLPVKISYAVAKNINKINSELKIYNKERQKLIDKYAKKDDKGNPVADERGQIKFLDQKGWDKDIKTLLDIENEIDIHKFSINELNGFNISPAEMQTLDYMIDEK